VTSTLTDIDICSAALVKIGSNPIQSFSDNTKEAQVAGVVYPVAVNSELGAYPWNFAGNQLELNQTTQTPLNEQWKYAYQLPADVLAVRTCYDVSGNTIVYFVENDLCYASESQVFCDYTRQITPGGFTEANFTPYFIDLLIARCAYEFAVSVIGISTDVDRAEHEYEAKRQRARNTDANTNQPQSLINPFNSALCRARAGWWGWW
jgi:hypothetical protein